MTTECIRKDGDPPEIVIKSVHRPKKTLSQMIFDTLQDRVSNFRVAALKRRRRKQTIRENLVKNHSSNTSIIFSSRYDVEEEDIAHGNGGIISLVRNKTTNHLYAMKTICLENPKSDAAWKHPSHCRMTQFKNESRILTRLDHPHILRVFETYYTSKGLTSIIMQLCTGGDLTTRVLSESQACNVMRQICSAVAYCHSRNICHRDLKLENILYENEDEDAEVKLIDFGLAAHWKQYFSTMHQTVGTMYSIAPEVLSGSYSKECDSWSLGVITYWLLSQSRPFEGVNTSILVDNITIGEFSFKDPKWNEISQDAKDFVSSLLVKDPKARLSASECLKSPWLSSVKSPPSSSPIKVIVSQLEKFSSYGTFKQAVCMILAYFMEAKTDSAVLTMRRAFRIFSDSGVVSKTDFKAVVHEYSSNADEIFENVCQHRDESNVIYYSEFLAAMVEDRDLQNESKLDEAFEYLDNGNHGYLDKNDLYEFFGKEVCPRDVEEIVKDACGSDRINRMDFHKTLKSDGGIKCKRSTRNVRSSISLPFHSFKEK